MGTGNLWNTKIFAVLLGLIIFGGILALTYSLSPNFTTISSTGEIATNKMTARSGSPTDIQNAVNTVYSLGGGVVYVPAGNFTFNPTQHSDWNYPYGVMIPGGVSVIGAGINKTILTETINQGSRNDPAMFVAHDGHFMTSPKWQPTNKPVRISGFTFKGFVVNETATPNSYAVSIRTIKDYRVDHNMFIDFPGAGIGVDNHNGGISYANNILQGVIDHNVFTNPYKLIPNKGTLWGYGIIVGGQISNDNESGSWLPITNYLGQYKNNIAYIENNNFTLCRHGIASNTGGWYVARYNRFTNGLPYAQIDVHGFNGGRGGEMYSNTIIGPYQQQIGIQFRGGGGVVFNNTILNLSTGVEIFVDPGSYPSYWLVNKLYVWENTVSAGKTQFVNGAPASYTENVNYFLRAPNQAQDGFTYTPYTYPHPLTLQP